MMKERIRRMLRVAVQNRRVDGEKGVTLVELLAVIVILAVVAGVAVPIVMNSINSSKLSVTKQNEAIIVDALNRYAVDNDGKFPGTNNSESEDPTNNTIALQKLIDGHYIQSVPLDGWGKPYIYKSDTNTFNITDSSGKSVTTSENSVQ